MTDYHRAIRVLLPDAEFSINDNDYDQINWVSGVDIIPTKEELDEAYLTHREQTDYIEPRRQAYPAVGDQLDALFRAGAFPEEMAAKLAAVKAANPKPE